MIPPDYDPERPMPWNPGGYSPTVVMAQQKRSGMARWPAHMKCAQCGELLRARHGLTPQGHALGWLLRGFGPYCYWCNLNAWQSWKRGMFHGLTPLNGF
jgi:hypothetical protein